MAFDDDSPSTLRDYVDILWRRKWIILQAVVLVPLVAVLWSSRQPELHRASASVLVNTQNVAANLSGINDPTQLNAERVLKTQVELARVPEVARRAVESAGLDDWTGSDLLGASTVTSTEESDVMTFTVSAGEPAVAVKLVNEYARQFTSYRLELDTDALEAAISAVELRMERLEAAGREDSALYASMADRRDSLDTLRTLQTARATVVKEAASAGQIEPNPARTGVLGLVLGIALGLGVAFLRESLDTRVRSAREIADRLRMPLLGRLPRPSQAFRRSPRLVTVTDPDGPHAEAFRMLMSSIDLVNLEHAPALAEQRLATRRERHGAESILLTSALEHEGKSTTAANLAVTSARAGRRVILLDLDFRHPRIHQLFGLDQRPGLAELATGEITLDEALQPVDLDVGVATAALVGIRSPFSAQRPDGASGSTGALKVIPSGARAAEPAWVVGNAFGSIVEQVRQQSDLIIVDGPPLLSTSDAVEASARVDALLMVARLNHVRRPMLDEVERILRRSPAIKLGFVATDAETESGYGYIARSYYWHKTPA